MATERGVQAALTRLRARCGRGAAYAILAAMVFLIAQNAVWMIKNQREVPSYERLYVSSRDIEHIASSHFHPNVYGVVGVYYLLRQHIPGSHLLVPRWAQRHEWFLEHVGHLDVDVSPGEPDITVAQARRLRRHAVHRRIFVQWRDHRAVGHEMKLYLVLDPAAKRYVMAMTPSREEVVVLPEAQYERLRSEEATP